jgi:phospholipid transport system substrate-binding protein
MQGVNGMRLKNVFSIVIVVLFSMIISVPSIAQAFDRPIDAIRTTVDAVLNTMKDKTLSDPAKKEERRSKISALLRERFNFQEMAKRSLAKHWKERTPEEKKLFVDIFSDLLEASYIGKIEAYTDEKVRYDKEVIKKKDKYAVVSTSIVTKEVDIPIDYKVINKGKGWFVYDVVIEGVSFISTYRSQYNKVIIKESFASLIDKMKKKLEEVNSKEGNKSTAKS